MTTASEQFLGCLMMDPLILLKAQVPLDAVDPDLRPLYEAMCKRIINSEPIDPLNLTMAFRGEKWWPGAARVSEMPDVAVSKGLARHYADQVKRSHKKRRLGDWYVKVREHVEAPDPDGAIIEIEGKLSRLMDSDDKPPFETLESIGKEYMERRNDDRCAKTGVSFVDEKWWLDDGGLHVVAARTGVGKTTFGCWLAAKILESNRSVLFFSAEMAGTSIVDKFMKQWAKGDVDNYESVFEARKKTPLLIGRRPNISIEEIMLSSNLARRSCDLAAIFVDYIQIISTKEKMRSEYDRITHVSMKLKEVARRCECPVVAMAQINRNVEGGKNRRPELSHLKGSGSIEQDADSVVLLYRDEYYKREAVSDEMAGVMEVDIAKQRRRERARMECSFDPSTGDYSLWRRGFGGAKPKSISAAARETYSTYD